MSHVETELQCPQSAAKRRMAPRTVTATQIKAVMLNHIPRRDVIKFHRQGAIFTYDYHADCGKYDRMPLAKFTELLSNLLDLNPSGLWLPAVIQHAITLFENDHELSLHDLETTRIQASNFMRYFTDLRRTKGICLII